MRRIKISGQPWAIAVAPTMATAYITRVNADAVAVLDTTTNKIIKNIPVGRQPQAIAISPDGSRAWIGDIASHAITVIDTHNNDATATITNNKLKSEGGAPLAITFAATPPEQH